MLESIASVSVNCWVYHAIRKGHYLWLQLSLESLTLGKWSERQLEPKGGAYEKGRGTVTCLEMLGNAFK